MSREGSEGNRFQPGRSGNPSGRKAGSRSAALVALDALAEGSASALVQAMIDKGKDGDAVAAKAVLDRIWPARRGARVAFTLPPIARAEELPAAIEAVARQAAEGELSPDEAGLIVGLLESQRKALETGELAARIAALEERLAQP